MKSERTSRNIPILLLLLSAAVYFYSSNRIDPDVWGHLTYGRYIFDHLSIPRYDLYSYAAAGAKWINHEWLSEYLFYAIYKYASSAGLIIFKTIVGILTIIPLYLAAARRTNSIILLSSLIIPIQVIGYGFAMRPQVFTYLFLAWETFLVDAYENDGRITRLYLLPVIFMFWANMHGGFMAGLGLLAAYTARKALKKEISVTIIAVATLSVIATIVNPYGVELWRLILRAFSMPRPYIGEWNMIKPGEVYFAGYIFLALFSLLGLIFAKTRRCLYEMVVLAVVFYISFVQRRQVVLFAILAAIYLPKYIGPSLEDAFCRLENKINRLLIKCICIGVGIIFIACALFYEKTNPLKIEIPKDQYPVNAMYFMRSNNITGNTFAWFDWAQECLWDLPGSKVFFDGRYETVYSNDFIKNYFDILLCRIDHRIYFDNFPETDIILLDKNRNFLFAASLSNDKEWIPVYSDTISVLWLKDNKRNTALLEQFKEGRFKYAVKVPPYYFE